MSHHVMPLIDCPALQIELNEVNACKLMPNENLPLTNFLPSPLNTTNILERSVVPGKGKIRQVQVVYQPRIHEDEVATTLSIGCAEGEDAGMLDTVYEIDTTKGVEAKETISFADISTICKSNASYIAQRVQYLMDVASRKMETILTQQAVLLTGKFVSSGDTGLSVGNTIKTIQTKYTADTKYNENGLSDIIYSVRNSGFCGTPFLFGYGEIWKYFLKTQTLCCAASGVDMAAYANQNPAVFMETFRVPTAFGNDNDFLALDAGALYLLQYNRYEEGSELSGITDFTKMGVIVDPKTGISWNYKFYLDPCTEKVTITVSTSFKVVGLPDDMYQVGDRFYGTNGVNHFRVTN